MTTPWISADTEIFDYDPTDAFIWYPDASSSLVWDLIGEFDVCSAQSGRINSGELTNTYIQNDNKFILNEMNNTPGFCYLFTHLQVPDPSGSYFLEFTGTYRGNHEVTFQAYNWDTTAYTTFYTLQPSLFTQTYTANIPAGASYYDVDTLLIRTIHSDAGNSGHLFRINYWKLHEGSV